jgi:hypothetical protein
VEKAERELINCSWMDKVIKLVMLYICWGVGLVVKGEKVVQHIPL